jgi:hypothetical protein
MTEPEKNQILYDYILYIDKINNSSNFTYNDLTEAFSKEAHIRIKLGFYWKTDLIKLAKTLVIAGVINDLPDQNSNYSYIDSPKENKKNQ